MLKKPYVYIAAPLNTVDSEHSTELGRIRVAIDTAETLLKFKCIPYTPHLSAFHHMIYPHVRREWLEFDKAWLAKCDVVIRLPGKSDRADEEVKYAEYLKIPVYYSQESLLGAVIAGEFNAPSTH